MSTLFEICQRCKCCSLYNGECSCEPCGHHAECLTCEANQKKIRILEEMVEGFEDRIKEFKRCWLW